MTREGLSEETPPEWVEHGAVSPYDFWEQKAEENIEEWGQQEIETLLLAMQEELGELTQAYLEHRAESGEFERIHRELNDLIPLCYQLHDRLVQERWGDL